MQATYKKRKIHKMLRVSYVPFVAYVPFCRLFYVAGPILGLIRLRAARALRRDRLARATAWLSLLP
jgi:hypothetical protein